MADLQEKGVKIQLKVIDTPGFGDNLMRADECVAAHLLQLLCCTRC